MEAFRDEDEVVRCDAGVGLSAFTLVATNAGPGVPIKTFDVDNDGTLDLNEMTKAATALFDRLVKDRTTLSIARAMQSA